MASVTGNSSFPLAYNISNLCKQYENSHITAYFRGLYRLVAARSTSRTTSLTGKWAVKYSELVDNHKNTTTWEGKKSSFQYEGKSMVEIEQQENMKNRNANVTPPIDEINLGNHQQPITANNSLVKFDYACSFSGSFNMIEGERFVW